MIVFWILASLGYFMFNLLTTLLVWEELTKKQRIAYLFFGLPIAIVAVIYGTIYILIKAIRREL